MNMRVWLNLFAGLCLVAASALHAEVPSAANVKGNVSSLDIARVRDARKIKDRVKDAEKYEDPATASESDEDELEPNVDEPEPKVEQPVHEKLGVHRTITIKYHDENLIDVVNEIANYKGANVIVPVMADAITSKVSVTLKEKLSVDEAWNFLTQVLELAGYAIINKPGAYEIVKIKPGMPYESLRIFMNVPYEDLPESDERIRCLFYLRNIKVPGEAGEQENDLYNVLSRILPTGEDIKRSLSFDPVTNAIILTERANIIKSVMRVVNILDETGFKEKVEVLRLFYASAEDIYKIFKDIMTTPQPDRYGINPRKSPSEATYFSKFVKIVPCGRLNTLIVLGREQAVDRVKDFINKYVDVPPDMGESVFHVYQLQYLDAAEFAPVLQHVVASTASSSQARMEGGAQQGGVERFFEGVKIISDRPTTREESMSREEGASTQPLYHGGNKLIIAARHDDWLRIKKLIEELDKPQPQVILEVLVVDLTLSDQKYLGSMLRNPRYLFQDMQFQSAQADIMLVNSLGSSASSAASGASAAAGVAANAAKALKKAVDCQPPTVPSTSIPDPSTVALDSVVGPGHPLNVDLLKDAYSAGSSPSMLKYESLDPSNLCVAANTPAGTNALSFIDNDSKVWSLLEVRDALANNKILSNPHVVAASNKQTKIVIGEIRIVQDAAIGGSGGSVTVPYKPVEATLKIVMTPRISLSPDDDPRKDIVQIGITVDITNFTDTNYITTSTGGTDPEKANRFTRQVITSSQVRSGEVIPIGGLLTRETDKRGSRTPILGKIPIIGWFTSAGTGENTEKNLTVFVCPTVVRPRLRKGSMDDYTRAYIKLTKRYVAEGDLFGSLKDPITRWYFGDPLDITDTIDDVVARGDLRGSTIPRRERERRKKHHVLPDIRSEKKGALKKMLKGQENPLKKD